MFSSNGALFLCQIGQVPLSTSHLALAIAPALEKYLQWYVIMLEPVTEE